MGPFGGTDPAGRGATCPGLSRPGWWQWRAAGPGRAAGASATPSRGARATRTRGVGWGARTPSPCLSGPCAPGRTCGPGGGASRRPRGDRAGGARAGVRAWRECMTRERWQARRRAPSRAKGGFCRSFIKSRLFRERHPRRVYRANSRVYRRSVRHRVRDGAAGPQPPEAFEVSREPRYHAIEAAGRTSVCRTWRPPRPCQPHRSMQSTFPAWILQGKDSTTPRIRHVEGSGLKGNQTCLPAFLAHTKIPTAVFSSCTLARESIDFRGVEWAAHIPSPCFSEPCAPSRI